MSKFDIRPEFECQNRISNVKMRYLARIRMSKNKDEKRKTKNEKFDIRSKFECQNKILNVKIRYLARIRMSK